MQSLETNIAKLYERIANATEKAGRAADSVKLLAVSKTHSSDDIFSAYQLGLTSFGENYLQEALEKISALAHLSLDWHFIGALQSNKTRDVAHNFSWLHTLDRLKIAQRLSKQRPPEMPPLQCCIQVNVDREPQKAGVLPEQVAPLVEQVLELPRIELRGLMTIPQAHKSPIEQRQSFAKLAALLRQLQQRYPNHLLDTLSMGMSNDLEQAIAEGATIVRVGTALFGPRAKKPIN